MEKNRKEKRKLQQEGELQERERQRERIRSFDKEMLSYGGGMQQVGYYIFEVLLIVMMMIPCQVLREEPALLLYFAIFPCYPAMIWMMPYSSIRESEKNVRIYEKIKYMPVDMHQVRMVRIEYLTRILLKSFPVPLAAQLLMALLVYHRIYISNLLYVVLIVLVWPFLFNMLLIWQNFRQK